MTLAALLNVTVSFAGPLTTELENATPAERIQFCAGVLKADFMLSSIESPGEGTTNAQADRGLLPEAVAAKFRLGAYGLVRAGYLLTATAVSTSDAATAKAGLQAVGLRIRGQLQLGITKPAELQAVSERCQALANGLIESKAVPAATVQDAQAAAEQLSGM